MDMLNPNTKRPKRMKSQNILPNNKQIQKNKQETLLKKNRSGFLMKSDDRIMSTKRFS